MAVERIGAQPVIVSAGAPGRQTYRVVPVTGGQDGAASVEVSCTNDLSVDGNFNVIHWAGAGDSFKVQRSTTGQFTTIGTPAASPYNDHG